MTYDVAVLLGSLRKDSFSLRLAQALAELAADRLALRIIPINLLPLYDQDLEDDPPAAWSDFREAVRPADAVLFVTPEYNRSVPAPLKNAIDVGSRPAGRSVFGGKPAGVVSQSPGAMGGFGANHAVRQSLVFLDMPVLQQPEVYLAHSNVVLAAGGHIADDGTRAFLQLFVDAFVPWVALHARKDGP